MLSFFMKKGPPLLTVGGPSILEVGNLSLSFAFSFNYCIPCIHFFKMGDSKNKIAAAPSVT